MANHTLTLTLNFWKLLKTQNMSCWRRHSLLFVIIDRRDGHSKITLFIETLLGASSSREWLMFRLIEIFELLMKVSHATSCSPNPNTNTWHLPIFFIGWFPRAKPSWSYFFDIFIRRYGNQFCRESKKMILGEDALHCYIATLFILQSLRVDLMEIKSKHAVVVAVIGAVMDDDSQSRKGRGIEITIIKCIFFPIF